MGRKGGEGKERGERGRKWQQAGREQEGDVPCDPCHHSGGNGSARGQSGPRAFWQCGSLTWPGFASPPLRASGAGREGSLARFRALGGGEGRAGGWCKQVEVGS